MAEPVPVPPEAVPVPPEVVEALVGYALRTDLGKALWAGYLLGAGLPQGDGAVEVRGATYRPLPAAARVPGERAGGG